MYVINTRTKGKCLKWKNILINWTSDIAGIRCAPIGARENEIKKKDFLDTIIPVVLNDLPFSRNQPQKLADV